MKINRSKYIGGSDAAALLGLDRWKSRHDVFLDKIGEGTQRDQNEAMFWGATLEAVVRREYVRRTGRKVRPGSVQHPVHKFIRGHVDGKGDTLLEVKTARDGTDWGEDGDSSITAIPAYYRPQLAHYMLASGADTADVAVLIRGQELRIYKDIERPRWADDLLDEEVAFWENNVIPRIPPELDGSEGAGRLLRKQFPVDDGSELIALPEQYQIIDALRLARHATAQAQATEAQLTQAIQAAMGEASYLLGPNVKISWKRAKDGEVVNWKDYAGSLEDMIRMDAELREAQPPEELGTLKDIYTSPRPGSRRFLVSFTDPELKGDTQ